MKKHWWIWGLSAVTGAFAALAWWKWPKHEKAGIPVDVNFPQAAKVQQDVEPVVNAAVQAANQVLAHPAVADGSHPQAKQAQDLASQVLAQANQALAHPDQGVQLANQVMAQAQQAVGLLTPPR